ncbi:MAG: hypothetical protein IJY82_06625 [Oscillospiraceae bacterium]|nr:hypothetical protein [Oscillospiraceae bacterium]
MAEFLIPGGVDLPDPSAVEEGYTQEEIQGLWRFEVSAGADQLSPLLCRLIGCISEPGYLFMELPGADDQPVTYYLDGLSSQGMVGLFRRYEALLINDASLSFGFGSHEKDEELTCDPCKVLTIWVTDPAPLRQELAALSLPCRDTLRTLWDVVTPENPLTCSPVQVDDADLQTILDELSEFGIYRAEK